MSSPHPGILALVAGASLLPAMTSAGQLSTWGFGAEELEYRYSDEDAELGVWKTEAFYGNDEVKVLWASRGEYGFEAHSYDRLENELAVQVPISPFFDAKAGVRLDTPEGPDRTYAMVGIAGLAPQWVEVDLSLYVSDEGNASAELEAGYELLLSNHWILDATVEVTMALDEDREIGIGKGLVSTETGIRLRYDLIDRMFSPYVGVVHERQYGDSADFAAANDDTARAWYAVLGARFAF